MFFTAKMSYLQLIVLERDFQQAIDKLAEFGWLEIKRDKVEKEEDFVSINSKVESVEQKIYEIVQFFNINRSEAKGQLLNMDEIERYFNTLSQTIDKKKVRLNELTQKRDELFKGLKEIEQFKNLKVTKRELDQLNYLYFTIGSLTENDLEKLVENMKGRLTFLEISKGLYLLFTSKKGKWTLESELKKIKFKEKPIPFSDDILPSEVYQQIEIDIGKLDREIEKIDRFKQSLLKSEKISLNRMIESFNLQQIYLSVYKSIGHSESTSIIEGWIIQKKKKELIQQMHALLGNRISIISYEPEEMEQVKTGELKVPVIMENPRFFKPFEELVFNYGAPVYGSVDPTVFMAVSFLLLFGLMFGDIGQGFVVFLAGLLVTNSKSDKVSNIKKLSPILIYCGITAMIFGYLYGSVFCYEHLPVFSRINNALFGLDQPFIINTSLDNVINIVLLTIGVGLVINLAGIIINILNSFFYKKYEEALFSRNGLAGFLFLLALFVLYLEVTLVKMEVTFQFSIFNLNFYLLMMIFLTVLLILFKEPVYQLLSNKRPLFHDGIGFWLLHSIVELIEIVLITMSNNLSFIRVGAFAVTHVLLSFIFLEIANTMGPAGIIIILFGNAIIIGLEGMIVGIQTIRLEYYEFFSKFFTEKGKKFIPFKIEKTKL